MNQTDNTHKQSRSLPRAIFLMGPTASGKTDLALALAGEFAAEIISVDSALVYRGMDIGSAKPSAEELALIPHHLIDIRDPAEPFSAAEFCTEAKAAAADITSRGKVPIFVGGTMLYFKALLEGMADMPAADPQIRQEIETLASQSGWPAVHERLAQVDPDTAAQIHPNHSQRLSRALEVYLKTGETMTELRRKQHQRESSSSDFSQSYDLVQLAIAPRDRSILHQRIALRYRMMIEAGLLEEVKTLYQRGDLDDAKPSVRAVGYRQIWQYLDGEWDLETAIEKAIIATRQLAKRQLTWLRSWDELNWVYTDKDSGQLLSKDEIIHQAMGFIGRNDL